MSVIFGRERLPIIGTRPVSNGERLGVPPPKNTGNGLPVDEATNQKGQEPLVVSDSQVVVVDKNKV